MHIAHCEAMRIPGCMDILMEVKMHALTGKSINISVIPKGYTKHCFVCMYYNVSLMGLLDLHISSIDCWEHRETLGVQAPTTCMCV